MEATLEQWEENEEVGIDLRGRLPRQDGNTITHGEDGVYTSQSSSEAESISGEEDEEAKGSSRNGFHMVSDKNGGTESSYGISGYNGEDVDFLISKKSSGNEILASEVESLRFEKSVDAKHQDEDNNKLRDEGLPGSGSLPSEQSIEQNGHNASLENGKAENGKVKLRDIREQEVSELYLERLYEKQAAHEFYCPNCNSCITKVLIRNRELENRPEIVPLPEPIDAVRCTSCFSFLIPAGNWFFPKEVAKEEKTQTNQVNILALALANLLGGLFIIGHHLWELKVDQSRVTSSETDEHVDRYEEMLEKRENFILHASVAILSFLIFGLVPPLVYCFSFRQSNDMDLKVAVVAASSLLCIILLATSKAYTQRPQKYIKTLVYYVIMGVGVAGVSYIAGDLIEKLVEKLGWFSSTVAGTLPLPQMSLVKHAWKSW